MLESPAFKTTVSPRIRKKTQLFSCSKLYVYTFVVILLRPEQQATFRGPVVIAEGVLIGAPPKKLLGYFQIFFPYRSKASSRQGTEHVHGRTTFVEIGGSVVAALCLLLCKGRYWRLGRETGFRGQRET